MGLSEAMLFAFAATIICAFAIAEKIIDIDFEQFMPKNLKKAKMKRILALVLCTLMTVALLAGCGSKKNDDTNTDKTWVVATDTTFRPFEYTDKDGNFVGIDVDIMAAVAADQGFKYELKSLAGMPPSPPASLSRPTP